jgi:hypothetical protein
MYYKILQNEKVIDVISSPKYVRLSPKSNRILLCPKQTASGIVSEDGREVWQLKDFYPFPSGTYETVEMVKISEKEYHQFKALSGKTPEEIIDEYTLMIIEEGVL